MKHVDSHVSAVVVERLRQLEPMKQEPVLDAALASELASGQHKCQELQDAYDADLLTMVDFLPLIQKARQRVVDIEKRRAVSTRSNILRGFTGELPSSSGTRRTWKVSAPRSDRC